MPVLMADNAKNDEDWDILTRSIEASVEVIQVAGKWSADNTLEIFKLLEAKILNNKIPAPLCQKVTDVIVNYLRTTRPEGKLEEIGTALLLALGSHSPGMVIIKLWDSSGARSLPPRSLLVAVGKLSLCPGTATYIGTTWEYILRLLRMAQEEEDMLAMCHALRGLVISARKHLDLDSKDDEVMDITSEAVAVKAYHTLHVLFNRWPLKSKKKVTEQALMIIGHLFFLMPPSKLKNQVNWLTRRLMTLASTNLKPFYLSQCICQLLDALALSGCGGVNLASQLENITDMLFNMVNEKIISSDPYSVQNHSLALKAFYILTKLYSDQVVVLIRRAMESKDPAKIIVALEVFQDVFHNVPQTEKLKSDVMNSVVIVIQEDHPPVRMELLSLIEILAQYDYLHLPQGNVIIDYLIKLSEPDPSNEEDIQLMCFRILQMVPLPKLVTLVCQPSNNMAFLILSKATTEIALKTQILGKGPYLSSFHLTPTQVISPQKLLTHLVLFALKPYRQKKFGVSSLQLLQSLHPITSLHPVINSNVGQLWMKMIPQMLQILEDNDEKSLKQKDWENKLLQFSSQSLMAINDDSWLEQLTMVILERINYFSDDEEEKAFLYRFFGFTLQTSRNPQLVKMMLSAILKTSHEELQEREGLAVALGIVSLKHLKIVLDGLQEYGTMLTNPETSILTLMKEHQQREWGLVCDTIHLSYGKIISENKGTIFNHLNDILTLTLQHYYNCVVEKDNNLKLYYLSPLMHLTNVLSSQSITLPNTIPQKLEVIAFMLELIRGEPMTCISSSIRQKAMNVITDFRKLKPLLEPEYRADVLRTCYKSVLSLPSLEAMLKDASSPSEGQANVELFRETMHALRKLMEAMVLEEPTRIPTCLELLDSWLNSQKDNERERAMWCVARILGFTVKMNNFEVEIQFTRLGPLVRLLAIRCQDPVDNISFLSSQAVYNLYCILLLQKQMMRKKQGLWEEEDKSEVYSAHVFHNNIYEIAKAFAEYFTQIQLTNLVLMAMEGLTDSKAKVSLAAAQLMNAVMKERGKDVIKIEQIVEGILERLNLQQEPSTREEIQQVMCSLAGSNTDAVVPMLLNKPLPWDRTKLTLWRTFGTQRGTTIKILQLLINILEKNPREDTKEMAFQPVAVTCALCEMLSGPPSQEAVRELYPRLLLAVLCHLYWVIEQSPPQNMLVYSKEGALGSKSKPFDPASCTLEVVKLVFMAAAYDSVVIYASEHHCWDLLSSPKSYYIGIMDLTSGIVKNCETFILHRFLNRVRNMLYSLDHRQKVTARTFYVQLLWHRTVAETLGQDCVDNLVRWIKEPSLIMKEIGLRGISNLALHPKHSEALKSLVPLLRDFLKNEARVTVQAVKALRNIIYHRLGEDTKLIFCSISKQLCPLINDERDQVRISATSSLGHMLRRLFQFKPGTSVRREIYTFLVPLLLSLQDNNIQVVKACGGALSEWANVIGWSSLIQMFRHTTLSDHIQVLEETCSFLVYTVRHYLLGVLLTQSFSFLKSPQVFLRTAALNFIGLTTKKINMSHIQESDVQLVQNVLESMDSDPVESVRSMASDILKTIDKDVKHHHAHLSRLSHISVNFLKVSGIKAPKRKKRLFKTVKQEGDYDGRWKRKMWNWFRSATNSISKWCSGGVTLLQSSVKKQSLGKSTDKAENV
ncbi:maestro heat-like repeat-containing protein family member 1 isoform X4 [Castor canadensis]|nr:maestro heat-like repeat-containing protein family member 1 isoform X3 [Castor canadensis]